MEQICCRFCTNGEVINCVRYGNGHINETYLVSTNREHMYILQKLNGYVFHDLPGVMQNIISVTNHIRRKLTPPQRVLTLVRTIDGAPYLTTPEGNVWRMYEFVTGGVTMEQAQTEEDFRQSAVAFGQFQNQLADFPAETLTETIPHFHDTPERYRQLHAAIDADVAGRVKTALPEIKGYLAREREAGELIRLRDAGELPLRVTHNDTKLNNVMLDDVRHEPLCVIDLDTVMPGLVANDFGDSIRFGASTAAEDEQDLSKVRLSLTLFRAYTEGFLSQCGGRLTDKEIETLPLGAKLMTLECGSRFLADYLNGDKYFRVKYPDHNLIRCRTQLKLAEDMERKWTEMQEIVRLCAEKYCRQR